MVLPCGTGNYIHYLIIIYQGEESVCESLSHVRLFASPPGSSVHGIVQARKLEWLPFPSPGDLPNPGIKPGSPTL